MGKDSFQLEVANQTLVKALSRISGTANLDRPFITLLSQMSVNENVRVSQTGREGRRLRLKED